MTTTTRPRPTLAELIAESPGSQRDNALRAGLSPAVVSLYGRNCTVPTLGSARALAAALNACREDKLTAKDVVVAGWRGALEKHSGEVADSLFGPSDRSRADLTDVLDSLWGVAHTVGVSREFRQYVLAIGRELIDAVEAEVGSA